MYSSVCEYYDLQSLHQAKLKKGSIAVVRVDFNVPVDEEYNIQDYNRVDRSRATIDYLLSHDVTVILITHFGRPKIQMQLSDMSHSLEKIAPQIAQCLGVSIEFLPLPYDIEMSKYSAEYAQFVKSVLDQADVRNEDCIDTLNSQDIALFHSMQSNNAKGKPQSQKKVILLENIRFVPEETSDESSVFADMMGCIADLYVNDAFACSHRKHMSIVQFPHKINEAFAGFSLLDELYALRKFASLDGNKSALAILSGSKVKTKLPLLQYLVSVVNRIALGGVIANTFMKARGIDIGASVYEEDMLPIAAELMRKVHFILPCDVVCETEEGALTKIVKEGLNSQDVICDIGPQSVSSIVQVARESDLLLWCGPMGKYEDIRFRSGTHDLAKGLVSCDNLVKVAGGGDTAAAIGEEYCKDFDYLSTGGGAFIDWICSDKLLGLHAISCAEKKMRLIKSNRPSHVAIIMDGNARWAQKQGVHRQDGYRAGIDAAEKVIEICRDLGIKYITLYAFSSENWGRPTDEIDEIMMIFEEYLNNGVARLIDENVKISFIGDKANFAFLNKMNDVEDLSRQGEISVRIAMGYGGKNEIRKAARRFAEWIIDESRDVQKADLKQFDEFMRCDEFPDPDLLIRTSGERRLSNFLPWESTYSELYFSDVLWPDFGEEAFYEALYDFAGRSRRYGAR